MLALTRAIIDAVDNAREFFKIEDFPSNFFSLLLQDDYIDRYKFILFKEDIGKLSGFIGYGTDDLAVICVNYKRPIGHQNFTLAHELGHWFLHKGKSITDVNVGLYSRNNIEQEANDFASELLYPEMCFIKDYHYILRSGMLEKEKRKELGFFVDELCHKYCLSYKLVLGKILYKAQEYSNYKQIDKEIQKAIGGKISECFEKDFYVTNDQLEEYQQLKYPYKVLEKRIDKLVEEGRIGKATAESLKIRNGIKID